MICWAMTRVPIRGWSEHGNQHPTSNIQHPTSNIQRPTSNAQRKLRRPPLPGTVGIGFSDLTRLLIQLLELRYEH